MNMIQCGNLPAAEQVQVARDLEWARSGVWVARVEKIRKTEKSDRYQSSSGSVVELSAAELSHRFVQIGLEEWHSRFHPVLAIAVQSVRLIDLGNGKIVMVEPGEAILNDADEFTIASKIEYEVIYRVVGHRGLTKPIAPFVY